jgi:glycosyltransferase involved in cell wall biosynthesis
MTLKILITHNIQWSHYKAIVFSALAQLQNENDFDLYVLQIAAIEKQRIGLGDIDTSIHQYPYKLLFDMPLEDIPVYKMVYSVVRQLFKMDYDVIAIPGYAYAFCWIGMVISKIRGKRLVMTFDSTESDHPRGFLKEAIKKVFLRNFSTFLCYGTKSREYLMKLGACPDNIFIRCQATDNKRISMIYNKTLLSRSSKLLELKMPPFNFIYTGRLSSEKNLITLLKAFKTFKQKHTAAKEWGLIIVGDGPERHLLATWIADQQLSDVYFAGWQSWLEVPTYFALGDVFILPSLSEAWGLVVNEAMACGLPVVVSDRCGAAYDLVSENKNGFTFSALDEGRLTDILTFFADNKTERVNMGLESLNIIESYSPEVAAQQMLFGFRKAFEISRISM